MSFSGHILSVFRLSVRMFVCRYVRKLSTFSTSSQELVGIISTKLSEKDITAKGIQSSEN